MNSKKRIGVLSMLVIALGIAAGCGEAFKPREVQEETDRCAICSMAVADDEFATQIVTKDKQYLMFDDIGCLNKWKTENGADNIGQAYVRDHSSKKWLEYDDAYYAYDASYKTPMAYGIVSFEKKADAEAYIKEQGTGKLMTAGDLAGHTWDVNRDMKMMEKQGSMDMKP